MFDVEAALREWRKTGRAHSMSAADLDELEDHLHSTYLAHQKRGSAPAEAFATSLRALGAVEQISSEYRKVRGLAWPRLLKTGWAAFAVAFLLPVVDGGITLLQPELEAWLLPGFQAISVAFEEGGVARLTVLTNVLMLASMWLATASGRRRAMLLGVAAAASALLNGWWLTEMHPVEDLRVGYYMWWASFAFVSTALLMRARVLGKESAPTVVTT